jgi:hypothetical protein
MIARRGAAVAEAPSEELAGALVGTPDPGTGRRCVRIDGQQHFFDLLASIRK